MYIMPSAAMYIYIAEQGKERERDGCIFHTNKRISVHRQVVRPLRLALSRSLKNVQIFLCSLYTIFCLRKSMQFFSLFFPSSFAAMGKTQERIEKTCFFLFLFIFFYLFLSVDDEGNIGPPTCFISLSLSLVVFLPKGIDLSTAYNNPMVFDLSSGLILPPLSLITH